MANVKAKNIGGKPVKWTDRLRRFVDEYVIDLNGKQAAIRAGYSPKTADRIACENLGKPDVAAAIQARMDKRAEKLEINADRVLQEIACMALYDVGDLAKHRLHGPEDIPNLPENVRRAIIGWSWDKQGNFTLKLTPKVQSLDQLGRHLKLFNDVGTKDNPLHTVGNEMNTTEVAARIADLLAKAQSRKPKPPTE